MPYDSALAQIGNIVESDLSINPISIPSASLITLWLMMIEPTKGTISLTGGGLFASVSLQNGQSYLLVSVTPRLSKHRG